jgi:hypothetical protein
MRPAVFAVLCLGALSACGSTSPNEAKSQIAMVSWMDWPAEVAAGQEFRTRMVVPGMCAIDPQFHDGVRADPATVTFRPYFTFQDIAYCIANQRAVAIVAFSLDTAGIAPALLVPREYRMQARAGGFTEQQEPIRFFGNVLVRASAPDTSRRNAGGWIASRVDSLGCRRVAPFGLRWPQAALVLEDQADTANLSGNFVLGYIYEAPAPVCGETRVFHLVTRN